MCRNEAEALDDLTDEELLDRFGSGDTQAFDELFSRYKRPLYSFILRFVSRRDMAEELLQEVFLKIIRSGSDFEGRAKFSTWAYRITRNLCVDHLRRMTHRKTTSLDQSVRDDDERTLGQKVQDPNAGVERQVMQGRLKTKIEEAVDRLPDEQKEVFLLREASGLSFKAIAAILACPENTVKSRMRYALERLRADLAEFRDMTKPRSAEA